MLLDKMQDPHGISGLKIASNGCDSSPDTQPTNLIFMIPKIGCFNPENYKTVE
jgi:hypothetical protein